MGDCANGICSCRASPCRYKARMAVVNDGSPYWEGPVSIPGTEKDFLKRKMLSDVVTAYQ